MTVTQLEKEAETMQQELKDKHVGDMAEITTIQHRLGNSLTTLETALQNYSKIIIDETPQYQALTNVHVYGNLTSGLGEGSRRGCAEQ